MEMIPHQTVGKHPPAVSPGNTVEELEEPLPITIIPKDGGPLIPTRDNVEDTASMLDPRRTHHKATISSK